MKRLVNRSFYVDFKIESTYSEVTRLVAVVATATRTTVQAQSRAVSLNVTKSLAIVALLG